VRPIFDPLRKACAANPGIVLSDADSGHYIRYYTECSVIADNFLLTAQHMQKVDEAERLFSLPAAELAQAAPYVKYVLVRPFKIGRVRTASCAIRSGSRAVTRQRLAARQFADGAAAVRPTRRGEISRSGQRSLCRVVRNPAMKTWRPSASARDLADRQRYRRAVVQPLLLRDQLNGESVPLGNDSFYHARRILDAVRDPSAFYQFDAKIHAPREVC
jgi:hypothetical protein